MARIDHTGHPHDATPAGRAACRKHFASINRVEATRRDRGWTPPAETLAIIRQDREELPTIDTGRGKIRVGSVIVAEVRGGSPEQYTVLEVSDDIKNEYPGWTAEGRWGYADQVIRVIKF